MPLSGHLGACAVKTEWLSVAHRMCTYHTLNRQSFHAATVSGGGGFCQAGNKFQLLGKTLGGGKPDARRHG